MKKLYTTYLLLLTITFGINSYSQNIVSLQDIETANNNLRTANHSDYSRAVDLIKNLHPKTYLVNGFETSTDEALATYYCETDMNSYPSLFNRTDFSNLEILTIKIHRNNNPNINLNSLKTKFNNLKYIYAIYDFEIDLNQIVQDFATPNDEILIIYSVSEPN